MNDQRVIKGEKTRSNILHAAIAIIAENGLNDISTAKLAQAAGVSKSTIFHHFKTSDEVLIGTLNAVFENLALSLKFDGIRDVEHFLVTLGDTMLQVPDTDLTVVKAFLAFFHGGIFNPTFREILAAYAEQMSEQFRMQITQLAPASVNTETIDSVSKLLLPMIDGIGFHFLLNQDRAMYRQIWQLQTKAILRLLNDPS